MAGAWAERFPPGLFVRRHADEGADKGVLHSCLQQWFIRIHRTRNATTAALAHAAENLVQLRNINLRQG
jgi:hypothetical protein